MQVGIDKCPSFEDCEALLCPLDESLPDAVWYPDEEICNRRDRDRPKWIRIQRKIKRLRPNYSDSYFTVEMLSNIRRVTRQVTGINPDGHLAGQETDQEARLEEEVPVSSFEKRNSSPKGKKYPRQQKQLAMTL